MILFHVKSDGQVTTTPSLVPQGSSMQDLVVLSELDYALCVVKLQPASGIYIPDIVCNIIETVNNTTLWTAKLPPEVAKVPGVVRYQLLFTAADGTQQPTLSGTFNVPTGVIANMPESVEDLEQYTINEIYALLANIYAKVLEGGGGSGEEGTGGGTVSIAPTEWTDTTPYTALMAVPGIETGQVILFAPADDLTKETSAASRLTMKIDSTVDSNTGLDYVVFARAESGEAPTDTLTFRYVILKTESNLPALVAMVGVDAYGTGAGIDEARVNELIAEALEDFTPEGGGSIGSITLVDDGEGNFTLEVK